ncbi:MAG TPA: BMP family ABC transporter substrate-binding protein [Propionibacteriaceae bacterium]|nr:BMP family ABC transporter substrate-binding protein [Propionibacteriaceae bacterium]
MKKSFLSASAVAAVAALSFAGCASAPTAGSSASTSASGDTSASASGGASTSAASNVKACMVSDSGGFDDKSFNQTSLAGLTRAGQQLGIQTAKVESSSDADYATNVSSLLTAKCTVIVGVGFKLGDAITAAAKANPNVDFAIVDDAPQGAPSNLQPLEFNTAQSSFLAGYLAAAMSKTGKVGTFGGLNIPTVTVFMDGFAQGVDYYNQQKGKSVQVLGWDAKKQDGQFVPGSNPFGNVSGGQTVAKGLVSQGADILFPVAGGAGVGALQTASDSGGKVSAIWVDTDGYVSVPQFKSVIMTSVYKGMDNAVFASIQAATQGKFSGKAYVGTLANAGTGLAPFHDFDSKIPAAVKSDLNTIKADIISGKITITSKSQPKS